MSERIEKLVLCGEKLPVFNAIDFLCLLQILLALEIILNCLFLGVFCELLSLILLCEGFNVEEN